MRGESERVAARVRRLLNDPAAGRGEPVPGGARPGLVTRLLARVPVRVPGRLDPGRRGALAVAGSVLVAALLTGAWLLAVRPHPVVVAASPSAIAGAGSPVGTGAPTARLESAPAPPPASSPPLDVVVDVAGKVHHPGLYHLPAGARVADALRAAGGPLHGVNLISLNLAARVADGQQIAVGAPGAPAEPGAGPAPGVGQGGAGGSAADGSSPGSPVDLNSATLSDLEGLPGVGPVLARHILDWRTQHGSFTSVGQLQDVSGIGPVKFAALSALVSV